MAQRATSLNQLEPISPSTINALLGYFRSRPREATCRLMAQSGHQVLSSAMSGLRGRADASV